MLLRSRDVITIGGRSFLFRANDEEDEKTVRLPHDSAYLQAKDKSDATLQLPVPPAKTSLKAVDQASAGGLSKEGQSRFRSLGEELMAAIKRRRVSNADAKPTEHVARPQPAGRRGSKVLFAGTHGVTFSAQLKAAVEERRKKMDSASDPAVLESGRPRLSVGAAKALEGRRKSMRRAAAREGKESSRSQDHRLSLKSALHQVRGASSCTHLLTSWLPGFREAQTSGAARRSLSLRGSGDGAIARRRGAGGGQSEPTPHALQEGAPQPRSQSGFP